MDTEVHIHIYIVLFKMQVLLRNCWQTQLICVSRYISAKHFIARLF